MITAKEYIANRPRVCWIHGLELMKHVLQADCNQTIYKDQNGSRQHYKDLLASMHSATPPEGMKAIFERTLTRKRKRIEVRSQVGCDIDIAEYIRGSRTPLIDYDKTLKPRSSQTIVLDMNIPCNMRDGREMEQRHKLIYRLVASAKNMNKAVRIIGAFSVRISERNESLFFFIVIKDFTDPLFENIWGALKDNATCNDLLNCIMDYLVGTCDWSNGTPTSECLDKFIQDEIILVDPRFFKIEKNRGKVLNSDDRKEQY